MNDYWPIDPAKLGINPLPQDDWFVFCDKIVGPERPSVLEWMWHQNIDWQNRDKAYWRDLLHRADRACAFIMPKPGASLTRCTFPSEELRRQRWFRRGHTTRKPFAAYGKHIDSWLQKQLAEAEEGCDYVDNRRWAEVSARSEMRRYRRAQAEGCCGFYDATIKHLWTGRIFIIGFNYGH